MNRRETLIGLLGLGNAALAWPMEVRSQEQPKKIPRIGVLWHDASAEKEQPLFGAFLEGLAELGYIDGRNIILEHRFANEMPARFESIESELVASKVDVLIGVGIISSQFVKNGTTAIPVIFVFAPDPVSSKLVDSLGHPGGNATGLTTMSADLDGKRIQLLKEAIPKLSRVAFLVNPVKPFAPKWTGHKAPQLN
jgi:putative ABC transport system substrate-binding protein